MVRWSNPIGLQCRCTYYIETKKEVKKLSRPYLEVKVVKVKKDRYNAETDDFQKLVDEVAKEIYKKRQKGNKGNWVNGENLDKIKFPCFCSFVWCGVKIYGMLYEMADEYILINTNSQYKYKLTSISNKDLKDLILTYNIHILKGKIILFEEEKTKTT